MRHVPRTDRLFVALMLLMASWLMVLSHPAQAQSPFGYVGSNNSGIYLGYVGGGGGPYVPPYGSSVIGPGLIGPGLIGPGLGQTTIVRAPPPPPHVVTQVVIIQNSQAAQNPKRTSDSCGPVVLSLPDQARFEPFSACPPGGGQPGAARRSFGPKIIRIE